MKHRITSENSLGNTVADVDAYPLDVIDQSDKIRKSDKIRYDEIR